jgi:hypothetical protein
LAVAPSISPNSSTRTEQTATCHTCHNTTTHDRGNEPSSPCGTC